MKGNISIEFDQDSLKRFQAQCEAAIRNVGTGTKKATTQACQEILYNSLLQVPRGTNTLANSAFYEVSRRSDIKGYKYEAIVGYGGNGDPINPKTGRSASSYMVAVHENMSAVHPIGKAKFLEDPIRDYANNKFERTVFTCLKDSLAEFSK